MCDKQLSFGNYIRDNIEVDGAKYNTMLKVMANVSIDDQFILNHAMAYYISTILCFDNGVVVSFNDKKKMNLEHDLSLIKEILNYVNADLIINIPDIVRLSRLYYNTFSDLVNPLKYISTITDGCLFMSVFGFGNVMSVEEYDKISQKADKFNSLLTAIKEGMPYLIAKRM